MTASLSVTRDAGVGLIRFTAPFVLDMPTRTAMADAFAEMSGDPTIRVIIVSGGPDVFIKGDVRMLADKFAADIEALDLHAYWQPLLDCPKPVIAAVSGLAWGAGCELAMMCDFIIADPAAQFAQPESRLGVMPGAGGSQRMVRTLGKQMTSYLLMTGNPLPAPRAYQLGLVCELAEAGQVEVRALEIARHLAAQPPLSLANIKRMLAEGPDLPLREAAALEHRTWIAMFDTHDQKEGMAAVLEGRPPQFQGR
ncbi:MAG: enoyl-CoA hydratase [Sphingomonadales bacterium]|nr:MAG: enoyl-CoA hydratase [Sphingomonadales bacterium]